MPLAGIFLKYAQVTIYWIKTNRPGRAGAQARCEQGPRTDILKEDARYQYWNKRATDCISSGAPFADDGRGHDCSGEEKYRDDHLAKLEDARKRLASCTPQP